MTIERTGGSPCLLFLRSSVSISLIPQAPPQIVSAVEMMETRTPALLLAKQVLSQLSYIPGRQYSDQQSAGSGASTTLVPS